jgi:transcriptional regulator with XRE-family HTH domain
MVSELLRNARAAAGISQAHLAALSGVAQPNISAFERGRRMPSAGNLQRLVEACGLDLVARSQDQLISARADAIGDDLWDAVLDDVHSSGPWQPLDPGVRAARVEATLQLADGIVRSRQGER